MASFPLVGLVLGGCLVVGDYLLSQIWPPALAAGGVLGIWVLFTGALHLDGFVDCCDALPVARAPEERLDILRDVHAGTFGIVGVVLLLLLKYAGVSAGHSYGGLLGVALFIAPVLSRWAMVYATVVYPYGRPGGTLGGMFALQVKRRSLVLSSVTAVAVAVLFGGWFGLAALALVWGMTVVVALWTLTRIPGLTGDVYGAVNELSELAVLLLAGAWARAGW